MKGCGLKIPGENVISDVPYYDKYWLGKKSSVTFSTLFDWNIIHFNTIPLKLPCQEITSTPPPIRAVGCEMDASEREMISEIYAHETFSPAEFTHVYNKAWKAVLAKNL